MYLDRLSDYLFTLKIEIPEDVSKVELVFSVWNKSKKQKLYLLEQPRVVLKG